jgi:hypothetical protein
LNDGRIQNPSSTFGIVPLSKFVPRGFGFVHHSIAILYHEVPNPNLTIRNFLIAVRQGVAAAELKLTEAALHRMPKALGAWAHRRHALSLPPLPHRLTVSPSVPTLVLLRCYQQWLVVLTRFRPLNSALPLPSWISLRALAGGSHGVDSSEVLSNPVQRCQSCDRYV